MSFINQLGTKRLVTFLKGYISSSFTYTVCPHKIEQNQNLIGQSGIFDKAKELMKSDSGDLVQKAVMLLTNLSSCGSFYNFF